MRKWYVPVTVAGLGGLGLLWLSLRGRDTMRRLLGYLESAPEALREFNQAVEGEISRLQDSVDELARGLRPSSR